MVSIQKSRVLELFYEYERIGFFKIGLTELVISNDFFKLTELKDKIKKTVFEGVLLNRKKTLILSKLIA